ncbi:MAG: XdhC family protein, partial [Gemmatimonadaceae bacterium]
MSDQHVIVNELLGTADRGETAVLVSVVRTAGSTYRGVGTRMIVRGDDTAAGLLSGGCLETDLIEHAKNVRAASEPMLVTYDTSSGDDFVWGLGLGCNGLVEVLLEPLAPDRARSLAQLLDRALTGTVPTVLATVIQSQGDGAPHVGERMLVNSPASEVTCDGAWEDMTMLCAVRKDALDGDVTARRGMMRDYSLNGAQIKVSFELVTPRVDIVLCGSGPDAVPVARLATDLGWTVTVVDHRPAEFA